MALLLHDNNGDCVLIPRQGLCTWVAHEPRSRNLPNVCANFHSFGLFISSEEALDSKVKLGKSWSRNLETNKFFYLYVECVTKNAATDEGKYDSNTPEISAN